jgi:hypothetical protein
MSVDILGTYAPKDAKYIVQSPNASLGNAQALSSLATGVLKNTTGTGVLSAAIAGVDFLLPGGDGSSLTGVLHNMVEDTTPQLGGNLDLNTHVITGLEIGTNVQAYSVNLTTFAGIAPSVDVQALLNCVNNAAIKVALGYLQNVVEDTTPQLGGQLDVNGYALGDGTLELLTFTEVGSAANQINITNATIGNSPILGVAGDAADISLILQAKGAGYVRCENPFKLGTGVNIFDVNNNELITFSATGSAVNNILIYNSAAGNAAVIGTIGDSTDVPLLLSAQGAGIIKTNRGFVTARSALTDAATIATDASLSNLFSVTLTTSRTLGNPTNPTDGQKVIWRIKQSGSGNCVLTLDTKFRVATDIGTVTLSTGANVTDYIGAIYHSTDDKWDIIAFTKGLS